MLTTSEKLNCKLTESIDFIDSENKLENSKINFNKLFTTTKRPASYMLSLYSNTPLADEIKKSYVELKFYKEDKHAMSMYNQII